MDAAADPTPLPTRGTRPAARRGAGGTSRPARRDGLTLFALALAVLWVYLPPGLFAGRILYGYDAFALHVRRLEFARDCLFGTSPGLPAWYPREFLGTPFWSNLQNFPLIPTRLPLLLVDPWVAHGVGVNIAAVLTALLTFLFCRRLGLGRLGAAVAAWTFACCAFFASRVMAGHLPLLEAYPALPLLLWLVERYASSGGPRAQRQNVLALGAAAGLVMLAGHPQIPIYALGAAAIYLPVRTGWRRAIVGLAAMACGIACMSFVLYPMALLVGRSTRVLALGPPTNDVYFLPSQLKLFVLPWSDARSKTYAFWDTGCYVGLLPLASAAALTVRCVAARRSPRGVWLYLAVLGIAALVLAFPRPWSRAAGGLTLLRSPARQLYATVFALALAAGVAIDAVLRFAAARRGGAAIGAYAAAALLIGLHAFDLHANVSPFVDAFEPPPDPGVPAALVQTVGDGRVAMDTEEADPANRRLDDVGVYDSILLARPYRAVLALSGLPPDTNTQVISAPELPPRTLAWAGARMVVTRRQGLSLPVVETGAMSVYSVPGPLPRAGFVPLAGVTRLDEEAVLRELRSGATPNPARVYLSPALPGAPEPTPSMTGAPAPAVSATVAYRRPSPDRIEITVRTAEAGYVRILESFDPGWSATVDGTRADVLLADAFVSAVKVGAGSHELRMTYRTPGAAAGIGLSVVAAFAFGAVAWACPRLAPVVATP